MSFSRPFILRPVATTLLAIGLFLAGMLAYNFLPVAALPTVDFPTIRVFASRPGADPETIAATVAAPLERRLGEISGVTEMTSRSSLGSTSIGIQFDLSRDIDSAARDVQSALNAAATDLPGDLPSLPTFRKMNPAAMPVLIFALTSSTMTQAAIYDAADSIIAQRFLRVEGVADVSVSGADQPAIRIRVNPAQVAATGLSLEQIRSTIVAANAYGPLGIIEDSTNAYTLSSNAQMLSPEEYGDLVVRSENGNVMRLGDIAEISRGTRNSRSAAWYGREPAVLLVITRQANSNVIDTVDGVYKALEEIRPWVPKGLNISVLTDRTDSIRASVFDMQLTLGVTIVLVMLVVFLFLRRSTPTLAAGITVPLSLAGTFGAMWLAGFSINNLSLMALVVSVGFVVDDAIVMIENVYRNMEAGKKPLEAALIGARQISFTVISISLSLLAAFIPLFFMEGIIGRLFREFSLTLSFSIIVSTMVSLSVTPMICAHYMRHGQSLQENRFDHIVEGFLTRLSRLYARSLRVALRHQFLIFVTFIATIVLTGVLFVKIPKGYLPQDDSGFIMGSARASADVSYSTMIELQKKIVDIILEDPAVDGVGSFIGGSSVNRGNVFINLKPLAGRDNLTTNQVIDRMRRKLSKIAGIQLFMFPAQELRAGARQSDSQYQYTLWSSDFKLLQDSVPKVSDAIKAVPGVADVSTDQDQGGLQLDIEIDREAAARLNVPIAQIDNALNNAFAQRQVSTLYRLRNQYRIVFEVEPQYSKDPTDLDRIYVAASDGTQVPLSAVARYKRGLSPLTISHQGQFPSVTVTFNLTSGIALETVSDQIARAVAELHLPDELHADFSGDARESRDNAASQIIIILSAILAVYIVLGVLYESLAHPLTIISTLPSAGLGALLALLLTGSQLSIIAFIGIILLIGIVKKNGIMLVDFALEAERQRSYTSIKAIYSACLTRFRPIIMTTMAAILGAVPLVIAAGPGSELRRPLGITIIGGLILSQLLTLYSTPVIYLFLDRLHRRVENIRLPKMGKVSPKAG